MKYLIRFCLFLLAFAFALTRCPSYQSKWINCGLEGNTFHFVTFNVSPDPLLIGSEVNVRVKGRLSKPITDRDMLKVVVKYGSMTLFNSELRICEVLSTLKDLPRCPIASGEVSISCSQRIPKVAPSGLYHVHIEGISADGRGIFCLDSHFQLASSPKSSL